MSYKFSFLEVFFHFVLFYRSFIFIILHLNQLRMDLHRLHHKLKRTSCSQIVNTYLLMMVDWTPKKFNNMHLQELVHRHVHGISNHLRKISKKWLMHMRPHRYLKCSMCKEFCVESPWGLGARCKSIKKLSMIKKHVFDLHFETSGFFQLLIKAHAILTFSRRLAKWCGSIFFDPTGCYWRSKRFSHSRYIVQFLEKLVKMAGDFPYPRAQDIQYTHWTLARHGNFDEALGYRQFLAFCGKEVDHPTLMWVMIQFKKKRIT